MKNERKENSSQADTCDALNVAYFASGRWIIKKADDLIGKRLWPKQLTRHDQMKRPTVHNTTVTTSLRLKRRLGIV
jgi:hypothetical protein